MSGAPRLTRAVAVGCVAAGLLAYEILLVRLFAIEYFHHFAYMAIGVAMLGFGASGTLLAVAPPLPRHAAERAFRWSALVATVTLVVSPALVDRIGLDPTQLAWNAGQWLRLTSVYAVLALPFGLGSLTILLALGLESDRPGAIYGTSLLGSGVGAVAALLLLWWFSPRTALAVPATFAAAGALAASARGDRRLRLLAGGVAATTIAVAVTPPWRIDVTPYKGLPQVEAYPGARRVAERTSPIGWVTAVEAPAFRHAPGLSLAFTGALPPQRALFVDGQLVGATGSWLNDSTGAAFDWLPTALPFALTGANDVLVIGAGGDTEIENALAHGARRVTAVEMHPDVAALVTTSARPDPRGDVDWVIGDARSYVARTGATFDVVTIAPSGEFQTGAAGVHALNEDFLHTVEAYVAYLTRLRDGGVLAITRWLSLPPRAGLRVLLTAADALRQSGVARVGRALAVVRTWGTVTVLVKPAGFTPRDLDSLEAWTAARLFDIDWPIRHDPPTPEFNVLEDGALRRAAAAAATSGDVARAFADGYAFDISPVRDSRPYPHHFVRTATLPTLLRGDLGSWLPFAEWGQIALFATLSQSVLLAAVFMVVPVVARTRRQLGSRRMVLAGYFASIGLAYMAVEIAAIQQLSLLLGHPVYAVAAVLGAFLISSGAGSMWSDRLPGPQLSNMGLLLAALLAAYAGLLLPIVHVLQGAPVVWRAVAATTALAPLAFLMGLPFPLGLRQLTPGQGPLVAWAWASNGFASVVATPLAALIALELGSPALFAAGTLAYAGAAVLARAGHSRPAT